jgi:hypothetical protein
MLIYESLFSYSFNYLNYLNVQFQATDIVQKSGVKLKNSTQIKFAFIAKNMGYVKF